MKMNERELQIFKFHNPCVYKNYSADDTRNVLFPASASKSTLSSSRCRPPDEICAYSAPDENLLGFHIC